MQTTSRPGRPSIAVCATADGVELRYGDRPASLLEVYVIMTALSSARDGAALTFHDFLPGIHLSLQSRWRQQDGMAVLRCLWSSTETLLNRLIEDPLEKTLTLSSPMAICTVSRTPAATLPASFMRLQWQ
jgi:hypothetical protein